MGSICQRQRERLRKFRSPARHEPRSRHRREDGAPHTLREPLGAIRLAYLRATRSAEIRRHPNVLLPCRTQRNRGRRQGHRRRMAGSGTRSPIRCRAWDGLVRLPHSRGGHSRRLPARQHLDGPIQPARWIESPARPAPYNLQGHCSGNGRERRIPPSHAPARARFGDVRRDRHSPRGRVCRPGGPRVGR